MQACQHLTRPTLHGAVPDAYGLVAAASPADVPNFTFVGTLDAYVSDTGVTF